MYEQGKGIGYSLVNQKHKHYNLNINSDFISDILDKKILLTDYNLDESINKLIKCKRSSPQPLPPKPFRTISPSSR